MKNSSNNEFIEDMLSKMTLKEKVGQLNQKLYGWECYKKTENGFELTDNFKNHIKEFGGVGAVYGILRSDSWSGVNYDNGITAEEAIDVIRMIQNYIKENTRLGIPALITEECPHGHQGLDSITFPCNIGMGSTWNKEIQERIFSYIAKELRSKGANLGLVSVLDILREPRWGRAEECFGEDTYLVSEMTRAVVKGLQGSDNNNLGEDKIVAVLKHLCAQGDALGGHNSGEVLIGERELRQIFIPVIKVGIEEGALGCMAAYNEIDGVPCHSNKKLLTNILRDELSFEGLVMADGYAIDRILLNTRDYLKAGATALKAGVDLSLWDDSFTKLAEASLEGYVGESYIDRAVKRILEVKARVGLFNDGYLLNNFEFKEDGNEIALDAARESIILLKNDGILPLSKEIKTIGIIGPNSNSIYNQLGDYTPPKKDGEVITILDGIKELVNGKVDILYSKGCSIRGIDKSYFDEAIEIAKKSDLVLLALGGSSAREFGMSFDSNGAVSSGTTAEYMDCGEHVDLANLNIGGVQLDLLKEIAKTGTKIITVMIQGRPHILTEINEKSNALLCAWYPGQQGGKAIAEVLFGDVNPSGKLSVSMPRCTGQIPVYYNKKDCGAKEDYYDEKGSPLFPFGYGLSYTDFKYKNIKVSHKEVALDYLNKGGKIKIDIEIENVGKMAGKEVVQLYIKDMESSVNTRRKELKSFAKEHLEIGESKIVSLYLGKDELSVWDIDMKNTIEPGRVKILIGDSSDVKLEDEFIITE